MDYEVIVLGDVDSPHDAIRSLLHSTLVHVANFQIMILKIIGEKYGHSMEDMVEAIKENPTFNKSILENPVTACAAAAVVFRKAEAVAAQEPEKKTKSGKKVIIKSKILPAAAE